MTPTVQPPTSPGPLLLDACAVAEMLGIGRTHLFELNKTGRLPIPIKLGRAVRWRVDELREWVAAGCPSRQQWVERRRTGGPKR